MTPQLHARWRAEGWWRDRTLDQVFAETAARVPDERLTLHSVERPATVTLADVRRRGMLLAGAMKALGIAQGDVVAIQLPNWEEQALIYQAAAVLGCVILPLVSIYGEHELGFVLRHSRAKLLFIPGMWRRTDYPQRIAALGKLPDLKAVVVVGGKAPSDFLSWERLIEAAAPCAAATVSPDATTFMVYTSGTTADPKGVLHSHNSLLAEVTQSYPADEPDIRVMSPYPAGHVAGALGLLAHMAAGRRTVLFDVFDGAAAARYALTEGITHTSGTPFHYMALLDGAGSSSNFGTLRACGTGGATVPESLIERAEKAGIHLFRRYGSSEHPTVSQGSGNEPLALRRSTDGRPRAGVEVRIVDDDGVDLPAGAEGEIATRGPDMFTGYADPAMTLAAMLPDGWFLTGDIGTLSRSGHLTITDRKKDIIIRGGENISSRDVEDLLLRLPGVKEAAAVAYPDDRLGERVCAYLITEAGVTYDVADIDAAFRIFGAARQKTPERVILVADLPRTAAGKIRKAELRRALREAMS